MKLYENVKKYGVVPIASGLAAVSSIPAFAASEGVVDSTAWAPIIEAMTGQISVSTVVGVLATAVAAGIGLVFMWWGARKATAMLFKAFRSGRTSV